MPESVYVIPRYWPVVRKIIYVLIVYSYMKKQKMHLWSKINRIYTCVCVCVATIGRWVFGSLSIFSTCVPKITKEIQIYVPLRDFINPNVLISLRCHLHIIRNIDFCSNYIAFARTRQITKFGEIENDWNENGKWKTHNNNTINRRKKNWIK